MYEQQYNNIKRTMIVITVKYNNYFRIGQSNVRRNEVAVVLFHVPVKVEGAWP